MATASFRHCLPLTVVLALSLSLASCHGKSVSAAVAEPVRYAADSGASPPYYAPSSFEEASLRQVLKLLSAAEAQRGRGGRRDEEEEVEEEEEEDESRFYAPPIVRHSVLNWRKS